MQRMRWDWKWIAGGATFALLALIMACGIGAAAVGRGALPAAQITVQVGNMRLLTVVTDDATCWRPIRGSAGPLCSTGSLYRPNWYYIGWLELRDDRTRRSRPVYQKLFVLHLLDR